MKYYVNLVQRGISAPVHPVSGKSGKHIGNATASPEHGGVVFKMPMEDYMADMHDVVGNTAPAQQWVPEFVPEPATLASPGRCSIPAGCQKPAGYIWDRHLFCSDHAPNNAVSLIDGSPKLAGSAPAPAAPAPVSEERPAIDEVAEEPIVQFSPPPVGSEDVEGATRSPRVQTQPAPAPEVHPTPAPAPAVASPTMETAPAPIKSSPITAPQPVAPPPAPAESKVLHVIAAAVAAGLEQELPKMEARLLEKLQMKPSAKRTSGKRKGNPDLEPSSFVVLQREAKSLGINTFQKGRAQLEKEIADIKANPPV